MYLEASRCTRLTSWMDQPTPNQSCMRFCGVRPTVVLSAPQGDARRNSAVRRQPSKFPRKGLTFYRFVNGPKFCEFVEQVRWFYKLFWCLMLLDWITFCSESLLRRRGARGDVYQWDPSDSSNSSESPSSVSSASVSFDAVLAHSQPRGFPLATPRHYPS